MAMSDTQALRQPEHKVPDFVIDDLRQRFKGFDVPKEDGFNPSAQPQHVLRNFGLPPRPDAEAQPLLRRLWDTGFGRRLTLQPFVLETSLEAVEDTGYRLFNREADEMAFAETRFETSSNWSGAYITANRDLQFMQVWGYWTVPANLKIPPSPFQGSPGIDYVCSNWIGLDGQRLYLDSSLPQIGTVSTLVANTTTTTAQSWVQWWARGNASTAPLPIGLPVSPGDSVLSVLTALDPQTVVFVMVNLTTTPWPTGVAVLGTSPPVTLPDNTVVHPDIAGATAEWIVERPRIVDQKTRYNFPNYGRTEFDICVAVEADSVDIFSLFNGVPQKLRGERLIRMFDVLSNPARTAYISMPSKLSDTSICVKWGGF
jgi:hypothetical protein